MKLAQSVKTTSTALQKSKNKKTSTEGISNLEKKLTTELRSYLNHILFRKTKSYTDSSENSRGDLDHTWSANDQGESQVRLNSYTGKSSRPVSERKAEKKNKEEKKDGADSYPYTGIIYVRVSSLSQVDGESIAGQIEDLKEIAEKYGIKLICEPIKEEGETGTDFDRPGFKKLLRHVERGDVDYVLVDDISRFGRNAPATIYMIYKFAVEYDTKIITRKGKVDVTQVDDLIQSMMRSLNAHLSTSYRTESSVRSKIRNFTKEKQWGSRYGVIPLGYQPDGDGWIETNSAEVGIAQEMFEYFIETKNYRKTSRHLTEEYGKEENIIEINDEEFDERFKPSRVRNFLERGVYIGKPTIRSDADFTDQDIYQLEEPDLHIIGERTFNEAQEVIADIQSENSTSSDTVDPESAVREFGLLAALESSPILKLVCPSCRGELRRNGQRELDGSLKAHNYQCKDCGQQRKWPYLEELNHMKESNSSMTSGTA